MSDRRAMDPRNRLSSGIHRKRLQQEARRAARPTALFVAGLVLAAAMAGWLMMHISRSFGHKTYEVRFQVENAFGVFAGFDDVRFRGVPAGTIAKIERHGTQIVLLAKIQSRYGPVFNDAHAALRPITPLNDMYLDITDPGTPSAGKAQPRQPLAKSQTTTMVTVPEVLDGLTADARRNAYRLLDNLGNGMADGGVELRRAFVQLGPLLHDAGALTREIALHKQQTERLVHNVGVLTDELGKRDVELKRLVATGAATLGTLQQGTGDLDRTLAELAPTTTELRSSLASVRGVVDDVDAGLSSLYPVADRLPAGLKSLRTLAGVLEPTATRLQPAVVSTNRWAQPIQTLLTETDKIATGLLPQVPVVDRAAQDLVACKPGVIGFFQWNSSLTKFGDTTGGPVPRGNLAFGAPAPTGPPLRDPVKSCAPGTPTRYVVQAKDKH